MTKTGIAVACLACTLAGAAMGAVALNTYKPATEAVIKNKTLKPYTELGIWASATPEIAEEYHLDLIDYTQAVALIKLAEQMDYQMREAAAAEDAAND